MLHRLRTPLHRLRVAWKYRRDRYLFWLYVKTAFTVDLRYVLTGSYQTIL